MELTDYFRILRRRGWLIVLLSLLTALAAYAFSSMQEPVYQSTARMLITARPDFGQTQAAKELRRDFAARLYSSYRASAVIEALDLDMTADQLMGDVTVEPRTDSNIIVIEVLNSNGDVANDIARVWGEQLIIWRNAENADLRSEDRIEAEFIDDPRYGLDSPKPKINAAAGAVFGALIGVLLVLGLEWIEAGTVRRSQDVERYLDVPVIGKIPQ